MVDTIAYTGSRVSVILKDGSLYTADKAIVTLPLGVLKARKVRFVPDLPLAKWQAIDALGLSSAFKMFFRFRQAVLPHPVQAGGLEFWSSSEGYNTLQQVVTVFATGHTARQLLKQPSDVALAYGLKVLFEALGQPLTQPQAAYLHQWDTDPHCLGAYSVCPPGAEEARAILAQPLGGLHFAGEATAPNAWAGSVHGALQSGWRAAAQVLAKPRKPVVGHHPTTALEAH